MPQILWWWWWWQRSDNNQKIPTANASFVGYAKQLIIGQIYEGWAPQRKSWKEA